MVHLCFLCLVMSHFVTSSIIGIEVSPFTLALISLILIHIQLSSKVTFRSRKSWGGQPYCMNVNVVSALRSHFG